MKYRESGISRTSLHVEGTKDESSRQKARQRLRLQRTGLAIANYLLFGVITLYLYGSGQLSLPLFGIAIIYAGNVAAYCVFLWLIATGRNLRFADPSLTQVQLLLAPVFELAFFAVSRTVFAQDLFFFSFLMSLLFGAFRLDLKQIVTVSAPGFIGFATIVMLRHGYVGDSVTGAAARVAIYLVLAWWMIFFASYIGRLRNHLSERNQELKQAMGRIEELAIRDELTGAYNRRFIRDVLQTETQRAERSGQPFSVCLLDVDNFKDINDTHGHLVGDEILCEMVKRIGRSIRRIDELGQFDTPNMLSRFGGEEFLIILPLTDLEGARACAERVRNATRSRAFETQIGDVVVTVSLGVAQFRQGDSIDTLVGRADKALYKAKENGRDRVEAAAESRA